MKIAIIGLGKMGSQIAKKLHEDAFTVIVHTLTKNNVDEMAKLGMAPAYTKEEVISSFGQDRIVIWLMLPSDIMDQELDIWMKLMPKGSIIIDGGNSDFRLTKDRAKKVGDLGS